MNSKVLLLLALLLPGICLAQDEEIEPASAEISEESEDQTRDKDGVLDRHKELVDTQVQHVAQWVDSFFSDPNFEAESANTLLRIRPELYYRKEQGADGRLKARVKFSLPNMSRKTSLIIGSDDAGRWLRR